MKIIYRYLIKNFLGPFVLTFFVALFILLMQYLWKWVDELVGKGLEIYLILELLFYASATLVSMALPLAVLLSSLMTFGNLGERYEIVALKSAGISIGKMMFPLACLVFLISCFAFWYSNYVIPEANVKLKTLLYDIREQKPTLSIEEGVFYTGFDDYTIRVGKKHGDNETIEDVLIYDHSRHQGNTNMTYAKRGTMKMTYDKHYILFTLYDGFYWDENSNQDNGNSRFPLTRARFKEQYKRFDLSSFQIQKTDESFFKSTQQSMPVHELAQQIDTMKREINGLSETAVHSFMNNLYFFNAMIKNDSTFDRFEADTNYCMDSLPLDQRKQIYDFASQSTGSYMNSVSFAYQDVKFRNMSLWGYQIELHRKFTLSLACFLFFFIGAPLGSIIRKGGIGVPLVITVFFFTFYFVISIIGEKVSKGSVIPVAWGMWFSSLILLPMCIFLTYKATVDSAVFSTEAYAKFIKKIKNSKLFNRNKKNENSSVVS
ncbi:MAG: LptF/LptG family permease [Bacteroidales bacterium]